MQSQITHRTCLDSSILHAIEHPHATLPIVAVELEDLMVCRLNAVIRAVNFPRVVPPADGQLLHTEQLHLVRVTPPGERARLAICSHLHPHREPDTS
jgi:hypothetical protein